MKIGDKVRLDQILDGSTNFFGHKIGDVGTIIDVFYNPIRAAFEPTVRVKGRRSTSGLKPNVFYDERIGFTYLSRSIKIQKLLDDDEGR